MTGYAVSALPEQVSLSLYAGDDFTLRVTVVTTDGLPVNLTGMVVEAQVRATSTSPVAAAFTYSSDNPVSGVFFIHLTPAATAALPPRAVWDVQMASADGSHVTTLAAGPVTVTADVTRDTPLAATASAPGARP